MEMSLEYAQQTADALSMVGYSLRTEAEALSGDQSAVERTRYRLTKADQELVLETVKHPESGCRYFLEIVRYHGLRTHSLELDSWKVGEAQIEFRYVTNPATGSAVTFVIELASAPLQDR